jgi:hypothetical protein
MNSEGWWSIGILVAMGYGIYRLWKKLTNTMEENIEKRASAEWKCNHTDEPNHDRIACYNNQATPQILCIFVIALPFILLFSRV